MTLTPQQYVETRVLVELALQWIGQDTADGRNSAEDHEVKLPPKEDTPDADAGDE